MHYDGLMLNLNSLSRSLKIFPRTLTYLNLSKNSDANTELMKMQWAMEVIERLNIQIEIINQPTDEKGILFVGNHISYVDIPLLLRCIPEVSFVAKKEVGTWPIIGPAAKKINTVFVDRNNKENRNGIRESISQALQDGRRIVIFPSGTTAENENTKWKKGALEIAQRGSFKIQPFRIDYFPLRDVAYIDKDTLLLHLIKMSQKKSIQARIEFHPPVEVRDSVADSEYWRHWTQQQKIKDIDASAQM